MLKISLTSAAILALACAPLPASASILTYRIHAAQHGFVKLCEADQTAYCMEFTPVTQAEQKQYCTNTQMVEALRSIWTDGDPTAAPRLKAADIGNLNDLAANLDGLVGDDIVADAYVCWSGDDEGPKLALLCTETRGEEMVDADGWFFESCYRAWFTESLR